MSARSKLLDLKDVQEMKDLGDLLYQEEQIVIRPKPHEEIKNIDKVTSIETTKKEPINKSNKVPDFVQTISETLIKVSESTKEESIDLSTKPSKVTFAENTKEESVDDISVKPTVKTKKRAVLYEDINEYICQNPNCKYLKRRDDLEQLHLYEVDSYNIIVICNYCHDDNHRFCLFTHDVKPINEMEPVFENMYAQPTYNRGQLHPDILSKVNDIDLYLRGIGIENPCPNYSTIDLLDPDSDSEN